MEKLLSRLFGRNKNNEVVVNSPKEIVEVLNNDAPVGHRPERNTNYPKEVYEIHHEFEIAAEKLYEDAKSIISEAESKDVNKMNRLEKLGFKQVGQVTELKPLIEKAKFSKEQLEMLNYYSVNYPNYKFITEEQVMAICYKWNLICGNVERFKGFVPEKNLKDIEAFKLKEKDLMVTGTLWGNKNANLTISIPKSEWDKVGQCGDAKGDLTQDDNWCKANEIGRNEYSYFDRVSYSKLQICAPIKDMDMEGVTISKGYKMIEKFIPDPVVLQPVKFGYLILTAWGDEASDENVVNQKMN